MPIIVNMPGGSMDSAGQGMAAAQGYRADEQRMTQIDAEAMRRNEAFEFDKGIALRSIDIKEQQTKFEMEQMAQQQEAEADLLLGQAIESGVDVGDQGAYREMLGRTSPRFRQQMMAEFGRGTRMKAEQQRFDAILGELDSTPKTKAKVESGELTSADAIDRSMAGERREIAEDGEREASRVRALESWQKHTQDPLFDMPEKGDDAYDDVMELLGEISPGAKTNSNITYGRLWNQLRVLTTLGMREAARDILERDIKRVDIRGLPKGSFAAVAGQDEMQSREQMGRAAVAKPQTPSAKLKQPLAETERAALYGAGPDADTKSDVQALMQQLGMKEIPPAGTPEYAQLSAALKALKEKRAAEKPKASIGAPLREGRGGKFL